MTSHRGKRARGLLLRGCLTALGVVGGVIVIYGFYFLMVYSTVSP